LHKNAKNACIHERFLLQIYLARAKHEQKESIEDAILRMVLNSYHNFSFQTTLRHAKIRLQGGIAMTIQIYLTEAANHKFLEKQPALVFQPDKPGSDGNEGYVLNVYDEVKYQEILGFGGAFTQASAVNYHKLSDGQKKEVLNAYFDSETGLGYNFCRLTINSCDFSTHIYSCDDEPDDFALEHFSIERDKQDVIPMVSEAIKKCPQLTLFASPWSPPAWMKSTGRMDKGGYLKPECRQAWADFTARFLAAYREAGIPIWGVTVQNEPKAAQGWESCCYSAGEERDFVTDYLKPAYKRMGLAETKIFGWDHNKERAVDRGLALMCDERSRASFDGIAVHWYSGDHFGALDAFHQLFPEKLLLASEQCRGRERLPWESGEAYAHDIIGDLNNWVNAWVDWNMLLDEGSGPDHWLDEQIGWEHVQERMREEHLTVNWKEPRFLKLLQEEHIWLGESPILCDHTEKSLQYASSYYYIGHFSRFIRRGARRIGCSVYTAALEACAFLNPDGTKALVTLNRESESHKIVLRFHGEIAEYTMPPHSIATFLF